MRKVMKAEEVCMKFVVGMQEEARTPTSNLYFDNAAHQHDRNLTTRELVSYRTPIALRVSEPGKQTVIFVSSYKYSSTTGGQLGALCWAIQERNKSYPESDAIAVVYTDSVPSHSLSDIELMAVWESAFVEARKCVALAKKARSRKDEHIGAANRQVDIANYVAKRFDLNVPIASHSTFLEDLEAHKAMKAVKEGG